MAVGPDDEVVGSVSGGCVEGAVFELAKEVVESGEARLHTFGYSDADAFEVGLTCGGEITLLVRPVSPATDTGFGEVAASVAAHRPVVTATVLDGPAPRGATLTVWPDRVAGTLGSTGLDAAAGRRTAGRPSRRPRAVRRAGRSAEAPSRPVPAPRARPR